MTTAASGACMLYWAEGGKTCRDSLRFSNSDAAMHRVWQRFLRGYLGVPDERLILDCNYYSSPDRPDGTVERYWLDQLDLPNSSLRASRIDQLPSSSSGQKNGVLPYGVAKVALHDVVLTQRVFGMIEGFVGEELPQLAG